nr:hypothetical protein [Tanacetum cinerariifolium]
MFFELLFTRGLFMASCGSDRDDALSKLLQMGTVAEYENHTNNISTQENWVLKGRDVSDEKSREVFSVTPWAAEGGRRVLCYVHGNGRQDCAIFRASVFPLFNPGPSVESVTQLLQEDERPKRPRGRRKSIKSAFQDNTLRARWF